MAMEQVGGRLIGNYVTMGPYDQVVVIEAPNDELLAKLAMQVASSGNSTTETMRAFTMDEVRKLVWAMVNHQFRPYSSPSMCSKLPDVTDRAAAGRAPR